MIKLKVERLGADVGQGQWRQVKIAVSISCRFPPDFNNGKAILLLVPNL
jgi:hypothetical protein